MGLTTALCRLLRNIMVRSETFKLLIVVILGFLLFTWLRKTFRNKVVSKNSRNDKPINYLFSKEPEGHDRDHFTQPSEASSWDFKEGNVAVYAIQGKRLYMEDRYDFVHDNQTGYSVYGIYDGHGGQFASEYVRKVLSHSLLTRLAAPAENGGHNLTKILYEEILSTDKDVVNFGKSNSDLAGTTALVGLLSQRGGHLTVANVGDSRGVICDWQGRAIPLSTDHKPNHLKERKRIKKAGGFISFNGVWRVAGILATSRALGDYPLKERNLVVADPDVTTFDLADLRPQFMILATDGLWDAFSNEEAVMYIRERLDEPHFGAKSLVLQAYYRGSPDNITVMVVHFKGAHFAATEGKRKSL